MAAVFNIHRPDPFVPYHGPPEPKLPPQHNPRKVQPNQGIPGSKAKLENKGDPASRFNEVKDLSLTHLASQGNCNTSNNRDTENGGFNSNDGLSPSNKQEVVEDNEITFTRLSQETKEDPSSNQPTHLEGSNWANTVIIEDSQSDSDTDLDIDEQASYENSTITETSSWRIDTINPKGVSKETQTNRSIHCKLAPSTPALLSMSIKQSTQESEGYLSTSTIRQPLHQGAKKEGGSTIVDNTSDCSSSRESNTNNDKHGNNYKTLETRKRKRLPPTEQPIKHRRVRNHSRADETDEYEVEEILDARVNGGKLEYRAKWAGYNDDCNWYNALGFKNSPYAVRDFHANNPMHPKPPQGLDSWIRRWESKLKRSN